jgi:hypothetical protein
MRVRIMTAPAFTGAKVIGTIRFEGTMDGEVQGRPTPAFLWETGVVPFVEVDKGLEPEKDGVRLMRPMPEFDALVIRAVKLGVFGTKMRSVNQPGLERGDRRQLAQQFEVHARIDARCLRLYGIPDSANIGPKGDSPSAINWNDADDNNAFHAKTILMDLDGTISTEVAVKDRRRLLRQGDQFGVNPYDPGPARCRNQCRPSGMPMGNSEVGPTKPLSRPRRRSVLSNCDH